MTIPRSDTEAQPSDPDTLDDAAQALFEEPPGYFTAATPPTTDSYTLRNGEKLVVRLVGHSPLWVGTIALKVIPRINRVAGGGASLS